MRKIIDWFVTLFFVFIICTEAITAQEIIKIDGAISYNELSDTAVFRNIYLDDFIIIKEGRKNYYLAIRSNSFTIGNVIIYDGEDTILVLHASFSLGDAKYKRSGKSWESLEKAFTWNYVDPSIREVFSSIDPAIELAAFYNNHHWVANTAPQGSYREMEFLIAKKLINAKSKILVAFTTQDGEIRQKSYWPTETKQFTQSNEMDNRLLNGYLPERLEFNLDSFESLKKVKK